MIVPAQIDFDLPTRELVGMALRFSLESSDEGELCNVLNRLTSELLNRRLLGPTDEPPVIDDSPELALYLALCLVTDCIEAGFDIWSRPDAPVLSPLGRARSVAREWFEAGPQGPDDVAAFADAWVERSRAAERAREGIPGPEQVGRQIVSGHAGLSGTEATVRGDADGLDPPGPVVGSAVRPERYRGGGKTS